VKRAMKLLEELGYIETVDNHAGGRGRTATRRIKHPRFATPFQPRERVTPGVTVSPRKGDSPGSKRVTPRVTQNLSMNFSRRGEAARQEKTGSRPVGIKGQIFDVGIRLLCPAMTEDNARSFLGKMVSLFGDEGKALACVKAAENTLNPKEYIGRAIRNAEQQRLGGRAGSERRRPNPAIGTPEWRAMMLDAGLEP
jgi:hypothetical protein